MVDEPLDLSCPPRFWADSINGGKDLSTTPPAASAGSAAKLSVSIPPPSAVATTGHRRFSHCSDNVSFSSDRSPSVSPASDRLGGSRRPGQENGGGHARSGQHSDMSASDSDDRESATPSPPRREGGVLTMTSAVAGQAGTGGGPATKRFLSKYIKEQVGK